MGTPRTLATMKPPDGDGYKGISEAFRAYKAAVIPELSQKKNEGIEF